MQEAKTAVRITTHQRGSGVSMVSAHTLCKGQPHCHKGSVAESKCYSKHLCEIQSVNQHNSDNLLQSGLPEIEHMVYILYIRTYVRTYVHCYLRNFWYEHCIWV